MPDIGKIMIAGLSLSDASQLIKSKVNSAFIGTEAFINLAELRDVNILVTGNAKNPGIYTLTGNSNILHAISAAGGISEHGSFREINLIRNDEKVESLDVYDLLIEGKYNLKNVSGLATLFLLSLEKILFQSMVLLIDQQNTKC